MMLHAPHPRPHRVVRATTTIALTVVLGVITYAVTVYASWAVLDAVR